MYLAAKSFRIICANQITEYFNCFIVVSFFCFFYYVNKGKSLDEARDFHDCVNNLKYIRAQTFRIIKIMKIVVFEHVNQESSD